MYQEEQRKLYNILYVVHKMQETSLQNMFNFSADDLLLVYIYIYSTIWKNMCTVMEVGGGHLMELDDTIDSAVGNMLPAV